MSDPSKSIDRVLRGLGQIEPAPGLQGDVLRQLQRRIENRSSREKSGFFSLDLLFHKGSHGPRMLFAVTPVAVVALLLAVFGWSHRSGLARAGVGREKPAERVWTPTPPRSSALQTSAALNVPAEVRAGGTDLRRPLIVSAARTGRKASPPAKSLAEQEAEAPSMVAPPLPLTNSERLLLRLAQGGRVEEYALLAGLLSAQHDADDRQQFRDFFDSAQPQHSN